MDLREGPNAASLSERPEICRKQAPHRCDALNLLAYLSKESALLGRRQVVRHWILIPAFEGSIPSAPAT